MPSYKDVIISDFGSFCKGLCVNNIKRFFEYFSNSIQTFFKCLSNKFRMFFFLIIKIEFFSNSYFGVDNSKNISLHNLESYYHQLIAYEALFTIIIVSSAKRKCTRSPSCSCRNEVPDYSLLCEYQWLNIITVLFVSCIIWCKVLIYSKLRKCTLFAHLKTCVFFAYVIYLHDISCTRQLESMLSLRSFM